MLTLHFKNRRDALLYGVVFAAGCLVALYVWSQASGTPVQDEIGHVVIARNAWNRPELIFDIWGRSANTLIFMLPALFGLTGARLAAFVMSGAVVVLATAVAQQMGLKRLYLIPLLLWFQTWFPSYSFAAITEIPFSLLLILGMYGHVTKRARLTAICVGLLPLVRHEGILLVGLVSIYWLWRGSRRALLIAWLPLIAYNVGYWLVLQVPLPEIPLAIYFQPNSTTEYGSGAWLHYVPYLIVRAGLPVTFWTLGGLYVVVRQRRRGSNYLLLYLAYFAVHSLIYHFGWYASGGYDFFLLPLAPALALLASVGVDTLLDLLRKSRRVVQAVGYAVVFVPVLIGVQFASIWQLGAEEIAVRDAARWVSAQKVEGADVIAAHVWFYYDALYEVAWQHSWTECRDLDAAPAGTLLVWDEHYSPLCENYSAARSSPAWDERARFGDGAAIILEKR